MHSGYGGRLKEGIITKGIITKGIITKEMMEGDIYYLSSEVSDEVLLYAVRGIPVSFSKNRVRAYNMIKGLADVVIFDDFFSSHVIPSFGVLVFTSDSFGNGLVQPFGPLREPLISAMWADAVLLEEGTDELKIAKLKRYCKNIYYFRTNLSGIWIYTGGEPVFSENLGVLERGEKSVLFSSVALPERFARLVKRSFDINVLEHNICPDHFPLDKNFLLRMIGRIKKIGAKLVITTEKDFWKFYLTCKREGLGADCRLVGVVQDFDIFGDFEKKIINLVRYF